MIKKNYIVADHNFSIVIEESLICDMGQYEPFLAKEEATSPLFTMRIQSLLAPFQYTEEYRQIEEGQEIICGQMADGRPVFGFRLSNNDAGWLLCSDNFHDNTLLLTRFNPKLAVDNALMLLFALASAPFDTALFHSSVVSYRGKGYMFLGKSGTGKSSHSSMWLKHISGSELVNDDNPVVRIIDGTAYVYGSPWSGKTPCYRAVRFPVGGFVQLNQAPYNKIHQLKGVRAYAVLVPSISGMRWNSQIAQGLHNTENRLVGSVPIWYLDCLLNQEAALLCNETITTKDN